MILLQQSKAKAELRDGRTAASGMNRFRKKTQHRLKDYLTPIPPPNSSEVLPTSFNFSFLQGQGCPLVIMALRT